MRGLRAQGLARAHPIDGAYRWNGECRTASGAGGYLQEALEPVGLLEQQVEVQQIISGERRAVVRLADFLRELPDRGRDSTGDQQLDHAIVGRLLDLF